MSTTQPEALRLADALASNYFDGRQGREVWDSAAAELRRQHARIAELEAQLSAVPLLGAAGDAGWVMVPVDPTPEMCAVASIDEGARITDGPTFAAYIYSAMLAASPPATSSAKGVAHG